MKRIAVFLFLLLAAGLWSTSAQPSADSQYLNIYGAIQQADNQADTGDPREALARYSDLQTQLRQFQHGYPDWNPEIVTFRLKYLAGKISDLQSRVPAAAPVANPLPTNAAPVVNRLSDADGELTAMRGRLNALQSENATLLAKLKEALTVQPALADAGELARAQEKTRSLMKEIALLKASALTAPAASATDTNAEAVLRGENLRLKTELAALKTPATNATLIGSLQVDLQQARQQIAALQADVQARQLEITALQGHLEQAQTNAPASPRPDYEARIRDLTQERDNLLASLGAANQRLYGTKKSDLAAAVDQLTDQVRTLRERLAVAEAQPSPYTPEELALLKQPSPSLTNDVPKKKPAHLLPAGSAALVAEAQGFFSAGQFDRAEADYRKILESDESNPLVLGNLAAIELQQGKLDDAEKHLKSALAQDPDDAFNLSRLGLLKFRQARYDEALDVLSRAAKLEPQNPEIQNFLGLTLSCKGLRTEAEAALRKAVELNPDYADAHNNLAAIYISATPPRVELARWHYQKALAAGEPHRPELEKALAEKGAATSP